MSPRQRTPEQGRNSAPRLPVSCGISRAGKGTRKARDTLSRWQSTGTPGLHRAAPPRGRADGVGGGRSREAENTGDARLQRARGWLCVARQNGRVWPGQRRGRAAGQRVPRRRDRGRPSGKAAPSRRLQRTSRSRQQCLRAGDGHAPRAAAPPGCAAPALACKPQPVLSRGRAHATCPHPPSRALHESNRGRLDGPTARAPHPLLCRPGKQRRHPRWPLSTAT